MPSPWRALRLPLVVFAAALLVNRALEVEWGASVLTSVIFAAIWRPGR